MNSAQNGQQPANQRNQQPEDELERIADPEHYNLRRRLKQLHDARERVLNIKYRAMQLYHNKNRPDFQSTERDEYVAEAVCDYISELEPVLAQLGKDEDMETESVEWSGDEIQLTDFVDHRGKILTDEGHVHYPVHVSMEFWKVANRYFDEFAGPEFEKQGIPEEREFQTVHE